MREQIKAYFTKHYLKKVKRQQSVYDNEFTQKCYKS